MPKVCGETGTRACQLAPVQRLRLSGPLARRESTIHLRLCPFKSSIKRSAVDPLGAFLREGHCKAQS
eukprot:7727527-Heterocapsa_arctica.AAC.1